MTIFNDLTIYDDFEIKAGSSDYDCRLDVFSDGVVQGEQVRMLICRINKSDVPKLISALQNPKLK